MIRLRKSQALQREIRQDHLTELSIPTWTLVGEEIKAGRTEEALNFMSYGCEEERKMHDILVQLVDGFVTQVAHFDEKEIEKSWRQLLDPFVSSRVALKLSAEETLQLDAEFARSHFSDFTVVEEPDRYVMTCDPCGSGGRLWRTKSVEKTKKAYTWSWGKSGVPYYCIHCPLMWEIMPMEIQGYPTRITLLGDRPEDPCVHLHYKKPELIPEKYFTRVGKTKTIK